MTGSNVPILLIPLAFLGLVLMGIGPSTECAWPQCYGGAAAAGVPCASFYYENPAVELFETVAHFDQAVTISRIVCQCRGGTSVDFNWDDDTVAIDANVECTSASGIDVTAIDNPTVAAGSDIDLDVTAIDGGVTDCSFFLFCE